MRGLVRLALALALVAHLGAMQGYAHPTAAHRAVCGDGGARLHPPAAAPAEAVPLTSTEDGSSDPNGAAENAPGGRAVRPTPPSAAPLPPPTPSEALRTGARLLGLPAHPAQAPPRGS